MKRKIISAVLVVCMLMTCVVIANYSASAATAVKSQSGDTDNSKGITSNPYGITDQNDNATILQAWNWSYANLEAKLPKIAEQGFSVVQISPPNIIKTGTKGAKVTQSDNKNGWWMFYQPAGFKINTLDNNALGTKTELESMVKKAHSLGVRVIADTVVNHMGTKDNEDSETSSDPMAHLTPAAATYEPEIYNKKLFHSPWFNMQYKENDVTQQESTYDLTRGCTSRLPDLATENTTVQGIIYNYLKELVDSGIDGFRVDAVKHIETPSDCSPYASQFLPNTFTKVSTYAKSTYDKNLLTYGEILNTCGVGRSYNHYFPYMKVTDSGMYRQIWSAVDGGSAASAIPQSMTIGDKQKKNVVVWNESHDTYMNDPNGWDGTRNFSKAKLNKSWAVTAARDGITSMYFARPSSLTQDLGVASETYWTSKEVAEVNKFNNVYAGQGEYLQNASNIAIIGRGSKTANGGATLVNCSGTSKSVSGLAVATLADGTYIDKIAGGTFTVSGGKVSGNIGDTGIAVLYSDAPMVGGTGSCYYTTDTFTASFTYRNVDKATYSVNGGAETQFTSGDKVTLGTAQDLQGATYKVTLKGYVGTTVKATSELIYTKKNKAANYQVTFKTNGVSGWSGTPYIYYWGGSSTADAKWPGVAMSGSGGTFTYTLPSDVPNVIFTMSNSGPQTVDLTINDDTTYTLQNSSIMDGETKKYNVSAAASGTQIEIYYPGVTPIPSGSSESSSSESSPSEGDSAGDVDGNGTLNINDVTMIQQRLVCLITFTDEQTKLADFNKDNKLNIHDATAIQYHLAGKS